MLEFKKEDEIIKRFFSFFKVDIAKFFPEFDPEQISETDICLIVLRDLVIADIFVARRTDDTTAQVLIDYAIPQYRDYKIERFLMQDKKNIFLKKGIHRLIHKNVSTGSFQKLILKNGFRPEQVAEEFIFSKDMN